MARVRGYVSPFPSGEPVSWRRIDQGQDVQLPPGSPLRAIGDGELSQAPPDPKGFGPDYPLLKLAGGSWRGRTIYYGHTDAVGPRPRRVYAGETIARTSTTGHNAPPGWAEIGFWPPGSMTAGEEISPGLESLAGSYGLSQLEQLWTQAGGPKRLARTMGAIALAESNGDPHAKNVNDDGTVDRGLWQINSSNHDSKDLFNPHTNARWAVRIYRSQGLNAWTTYRNGAYKKHLGPTGSVPEPGSLRQRPGDGGDGGGGVAGFFGDVAGGIEGGAEGLWKGALGTFSQPWDVIKAALWLMNPRTWLRAAEFFVGTTLMLFALIGLAASFLSKSDTVRRSARAASLAPGPIGAVGKALTAVGGRRRSSSTRRTSSGAVEEARVATERERRKEVRSRRRRHVEEARDRRREREKRERRAYYEGARDVVTIR